MIFENWLSVLIFLHVTLGPLECQCQSQNGVSIGRLHSFDHDINSAGVFILNEKRIQIKDFTYDGTGPAAWFVLGRGRDYLKERIQLKNITLIPDETSSCKKLKKYTGKTIDLTLPDKYTFKDFDYLSIFCLQFNHNFGYIAIPKNVEFAKAYPTSLRECRTKWNPISNSQSAESDSFKPQRGSGSSMKSAVNSKNSSLGNRNTVLELYCAVRLRLCPVGKNTTTCRLNNNVCRNVNH